MPWGVEEISSTYRQSPFIKRYNALQHYLEINRVGYIRTKVKFPYAIFSISLPISPLPTALCRANTCSQPDQTPQQHRAKTIHKPFSLPHQFTGAYLLPSTPVTGPFPLPPGLFPSPSNLVCFGLPCLRCSAALSESSGSSDSGLRSDVDIFASRRRLRRLERSRSRSR